MSNDTVEIKNPFVYVTVLLGSRLTLNAIATCLRDAGSDHAANLIDDVCDRLGSVHAVLCGEEPEAE